MGVASAVLCAEELEGELEREVARARAERSALKAMDTGKIEARVAERLLFQERAEELQKRLRALVREAADEAGIPSDGAEVPAKLAALSPEGAQLAGRVAAIRALARELDRISALNKLLAERALAVTRAYSRALARRPAAYDRRGAEPSTSSTLSSFSRRA